MQTSTIVYNAGLGNFDIKSLCPNYNRLTYGKTLFINPAHLYCGTNSSANQFDHNFTISYNASNGIVYTGNGDSNLCIHNASFYYNPNV